MRNIKIECITVMTHFLSTQNTQNTKSMIMSYLKKIRDLRTVKTDFNQTRYQNMKATYNENHYTSLMPI